MSSPSLNVQGSRGLPRPRGSILFPRVGSHPCGFPRLLALGSFLHRHVELFHHVPGGELGVSMPHCLLLAAAPQWGIICTAVLRARSLGLRGAEHLAGVPMTRCWEVWTSTPPPTALFLLFLRTCGIRRLVHYSVRSCGVSRERGHSQPTSGPWSPGTWGMGGLEKPVQKTGCSSHSENS